VIRALVAEGHPVIVEMLAVLSPYPPIVAAFAAEPPLFSFVAK
jgi:hypothetical protein